MESRTSKTQSEEEEGQTDKQTLLIFYEGNWVGNLTEHFYENVLIKINFIGIKIQDTLTNCNENCAVFNMFCDHGGHI